MRLLIPFGRVVHIELQDPSFPGQKLSKKIYDISAGGLSFIVTDNGAPLFPAGIQLKSIFFSIGSRKIIADGEVRHTRAQPAESAQPGHKVGVIFTRIGAGDQAWIAAYVFEGRVARSSLILCEGNATESFDMSLLASIML